MGLDIRIPIGLMFALIGLLLALYGLLTAGDGEIYRRSLGININLWWGLGMLIFGALMLFAGRRSVVKDQDPKESGDNSQKFPAQEQLIERHEETSGLENQKVNERVL